jgi:transcriptional regulator with XRE-family HTH domain
MIFVVGKDTSSKERQIYYALLRQARLDAKLRQAELAARLQKPQSYVSKYESGERRLDILELRDICQALGINVTDLVRTLDELLS